MGFQDRDYYRGSSSRNEYYQISPQQSWVLAIIMINVLVFLANMFSQEGVINNTLSMNILTLVTPTEWWKLLTYGFAHADTMHIFFNMLTLFIFGPLVERRYGPVEFLCFYLVTIVVCGIVWGLFNLGLAAQYLHYVQETGNAADLQPLGLLGASGGICGIVILVVCNYPKMLVYLMGIVEMPMWVMGIIFIVVDLLGFAGVTGGNVAYQAHLAGSAFAGIYYWFGWSFISTPMLFSASYWEQRKRRKKFFNPKDYSRNYEFDDNEISDEETQRLAEADEARTEEVDAILRKISEKGKDSLTWREQRILKRASKEYQKKHKPK